jgi:hypothetical protein
MVDPIEGTPRSSHYLSKSLKILPMIVFYKGKMVDIICPHGKTKKASRK